MPLRAVTFVLPAPTLAFSGREFPTAAVGNGRELSKCYKGIFVNCKIDKIKMMESVAQ